MAELCAGLPLALRIAAADLAEEAGLDPAAYLARLAEETGWVMGQAAAANNLIGACSDIGRLREGIAYGVTALRICQENGQLTAQCVILDALGSLHADLGEIHTAAEYFLAEHETAVKAGIDAFESTGLVDLADAELMRERLGVANDHMDKVLKALDDRLSVGFRVIAKIELALKRSADADNHAGFALRRNRETGYRLAEAESLHVNGDVREAAGDSEGARRYRREARDLYDEMGAVPPPG